MVDMPAYTADDQFGDDAFADELSGDNYASASPGQRSRPRTQPVQGEPRGLAGVARKQLFGIAEGGKTELLHNVAGMVTMIREIAAKVEEFGVEPFSGYARQASHVVGEIHDELANKSVEALIEDGRVFVRDNPQVVIVVAVITGFIGARLLKARP